MTTVDAFYFLYTRNALMVIIILFTIIVFILGGARALVWAYKTASLTLLLVTREVLLQQWIQSRFK